MDIRYANASVTDQLSSLCYGFDSLPRHATCQKPPHLGVCAGAIIVGPVVS